MQEVYIFQLEFNRSEMSLPLGSLEAVGKKILNVKRILRVSYLMQLTLAWNNSTSVCKLLSQVGQKYVFLRLVWLFKCINGS